MKKPRGRVGAVLGFAWLAAACAASGAGGREVTIIQQEESCTPLRVDVTPGEKIQFVVTNESNHDVYELEGIEGTRLEEFVVPSGKTRTSGYTVPGDENRIYKLKCYVPSGPATTIELVAGEGASRVTPEADPSP